MGFLDRLLGRDPAPLNAGSPGGYAGPSRPAPAQGSQPGPSVTEDQAVARYRYLLRTAPPEQLEALHAEAFARLTPEQRQQLLRELGSSLPAGEQVRSDSPQDLARAATRGEMRQPGYLQNTFSRGSFGGGAGMGGIGGTLMGSMMGTIAGVVIGSAIATALFDGYADSPEAQAAGDPGPSGEPGASADQGGTGGTDGADSGGADAGAADPAGDFGGGDFGGGDFGGGFDGGF